MHFLGSPPSDIHFDLQNRRAASLCSQSMIVAPSRHGGLAQKHKLNAGPIYPDYSQASQLDCIHPDFAASRTGLLDPVDMVRRLIVCPHLSWNPLETRLYNMPPIAHLS